MVRSLAFTEGFGNAGRLYERLRKRSLRAANRGLKIGQVLGNGAVDPTYDYMALDHQAYVKGLHDGIAGCLALDSKGMLY
jgi:hypothetical protein